jgi:hypothetical protein
MNQVGREASPSMRMPVVISASTTGGGHHGGHDVGRDVGLGSDSPAAGGETQGATAHLKKQRRNERDRRRSLLKRVRAV